MMKNRSQILCWALVGFVAAAVGTGSATAESCGTAADRADVVRAVQTMFVAAAKDNIALFHTVTSPDFYAFDNGKQFHGDELMGLMQQLHAKGHVYVWKVTGTQGLPGLPHGWDYRDQCRFGRWQTDALAGVRHSEQERRQVARGILQQRASRGDPAFTPAREVILVAPGTRCVGSSEGVPVNVLLLQNREHWRLRFRAE